MSISSRLPCSGTSDRNLLSPGQNKNGSPVFRKRGKGLFLSPCHGVFCLPLNIALPKVQGFSHSKCRPSQGAPAGEELPVTQSPGCVPSPPPPHVLAQVTAWDRATVLTVKNVSVSGKHRRHDPDPSGAKGPSSGHI